MLIPAFPAKSDLPPTIFLEFFCCQKLRPSSENNSCLFHFSYAAKSLICCQKLDLLQVSSYLAANHWHTLWSLRIQMDHRWTKRYHSPCCCCCSKRKRGGRSNSTNAKQLFLSSPLPRTRPPQTPRPVASEFLACSQLIRPMLLLLRSNSIRANAPDLSIGRCPNVVVKRAQTQRIRFPN